MDIPRRLQHVGPNDEGKGRAVPMSTPQTPRFRRDLSAPGLIRIMRECFGSIEDPAKASRGSLADNMMVALAMFMFKEPFMPGFGGTVRGGGRDKDFIRNLKALYGLRHVPSETSMLERLDGVDPKALRPAFKKVFSALQRGNGLRGMEAIDGHYLISIDGTEFFSSGSDNCGICCERLRRDGEEEYFHRMICANLVGTETGSAFPLVMPEMVAGDDGPARNDRERDALMRLLPELRREHPHLRMAVLLDGLHSRAPQIRMLRELGMNFIIGIKGKDHGPLHGQLETDGETHEIRDPDGTVHSFRWRNGAELNDSDRDILVNAVSYSQFTPEYSVRKAGGRRRIVEAKTIRFCWITDFGISKPTLMPLMRAGRVRWRVDKEVLSTLNQSQEFGHGERNLSSVMAVLMMLAYLIDQVQERCCPVFQAARASTRTRASLRMHMRACLIAANLDGWNDLMH